MALYHVDTNILIDLMSLRRTVKFFKEEMILECDLQASIISITEFFSGANSLEKKIMKKWVESNELTIIPFHDLSDTVHAADIRRKTKLRLPDSIILSTAIQHKAHLLTNDKQLLDIASRYISVSNPLDYE